MLPCLVWAWMLQAYLVKASGCHHRCRRPEQIVWAKLQVHLRESPGDYACNLEQPCLLDRDLTDTMGGSAAMLAPWDQCGGLNNAPDGEAGNQAWPSTSCPAGYTCSYSAPLSAWLG